MRQENLTTVKAGISRQRLKGAALKDALYDLLNGYVSSEKTVRVRPGTFRDYALPAGTVGLTGYAGALHVFADDDVADIPDGVTLHILRDDGGGSLSRVHFAAPYLGALYIVAEFDTDNIWHYWLDTPATWEADTTYYIGDRVIPVTENGFVYTPTRTIGPYPQWSAGAPRTVGDKIEPTTYNGFYYQVTEVSGSNPASGDAEPDWVATDGAEIIESTDGTDYSNIDPTPPDDSTVTPIPGGVRTRRYRGR